MTDLSCYSNTEIKSYFYKCAKSNKKSTRCSECIKDYYLSKINLKCNKIPGCALYDNNKCILCEDDFCHDLKSDSCFPNKINSNNKFCLNCYETNSENNACINCTRGFIVGENGVCINTLNCEEAINGICIKCKDNFCLDKNKKCQETDINNCLKCENDYKKCTECNKGFVLNENNICLKCENGCKFCTSDNKCLECFDGFYLENNICKECNKDCKKCLNENECLVCNNGYYQDNENGESKCVNCPEGCDECNDIFNCIKCKNNYKLIDIQGENYCIRTKKN